MDGSQRDTWTMVGHPDPITASKPQWQGQTMVAQQDHIMIEWLDCDGTPRPWWDIQSLIQNPVARPDCGGTVELAHVNMTGHNIQSSVNTWTSNDKSGPQQHGWTMAAWQSQMVTKWLGCDGTSGS